MNWFRRLFCKHHYRHGTKESKFASLNGERVYMFCTKCCHVKGSYFREYEGNGYK